MGKMGFEVRLTLLGLLPINVTFRFAYRTCEVHVFLTAVSDERDRIGLSYFPRGL